MFISGIVTRGDMATSKTGSFWLTEEVTLDTTDAVVTGTIDLGAYIDVGDQQALAVESVDFIVQAFNTTNNAYSNSYAGAAGGPTEWGMQLTGLNPGGQLLGADDNSLIASAALLYNDASVASIGPDLFPDNFGKLDESRMVVNDQLYFTSVFHVTALAANREWKVTARIKARIVKLSTKDWMAIAIQSTAADN
jgi:hypothetical protein